jgi:RNA polymerase sigma factor (sigma-70 family)
VGPIFAAADIAVTAASGIHDRSAVTFSRLVTTMAETMRTEDAELVARARLRDAGAFGELVERHQRLVLGVALARCGDPALAEDVAQEAFVTAWRDLHRLREAGRVATWIAGIARNLAAAASRTKRRRDRATLPEAEPVPTPSDVALDREDRELLAHGLADVPDAQREVLVLYYLEGESIARIAEGLGVGEDVVKQRLSRGRRVLRDSVATRVESALARVRGRPSLRAGVIAALPTAGARKAAASSVAGKVIAMMSMSKVLIGVAAVAVASGGLWLATKGDDEAARAAPAGPAGAPATAAVSAATPPGAVHVRRIDATARARLLEQIRAAEQHDAAAPRAAAAETAYGHDATPRPALADTPDLDKAYIQSAVQALVPQLTDCYERSLETNPALAGKLVVDFTIEGEPGVGGVVTQSSIDVGASDIKDPALSECVAQTMYALEIDPPANGGTVRVAYPFQFAPAP